MKKYLTMYFHFCSDAPKFNHYRAFMKKTSSRLSILPHQHQLRDRVISSQIHAKMRHLFDALYDYQIQINSAIVECRRWGDLLRFDLFRWLLRRYLMERASWPHRITFVNTTKY